MQTRVPRYICEDSESLNGIAKKTGTDASELLSINAPLIRHLTMRAKLQEGTVIQLAAQESAVDGDGLVAIALLQRRGPASAREYLVQWKGLSVQESTWEPEKNIGADLISRFSRRSARDLMRLAIGDVRNAHTQECKNVV